MREISTDFSGSGKKGKTTDNFLAVSKFGETRQESDDEDDARLSELTPNTKRRVVHEI